MNNKNNILKDFFNLNYTIEKKEVKEIIDDIKPVVIKKRRNKLQYKMNMYNKEGNLI